MSSINLNVAPYYDDYSEAKNFHKVLFKPGVAVQARELTQLQTILQNQIDRFGRHIFTDGAMVIPGHLSVDTTIDYVTVQPSYNGVSVGSYLEDFIGTKVSNSNGTTATVIAATPIAGLDPVTLFVKYTDSGSLTEDTFAVSDTITSTAGPSIAAVVTGVGTGSIASVQSGVYFINGHFVRNDAQTIVLDKYSATPSYRIGFLIDEQLISSTDDNSLLDNAAGFSNYAAPGADRYKIILTLIKLPLSSALDQDFVELARIDNGVLKQLVKFTEYSILEETLARRTFDESGNYTVVPFQVDAKESRKNYRKDWGAGNVYIIGDVVDYNGNVYVSLTNNTNSNTSPDLNSTDWRVSIKPFYNNGLLTVEEGGNEANLAIGLEPGKAYVLGFEIEKIAKQYINLPKARDYITITDDIINTNIGNYVIIKNLDGVLDTTRYASIVLYDQFNSAPGTPSGNVVGNAKIRYFEHEEGTLGNSECKYKLSLFDVKMDSGKTFSRNVKQIYCNNGAGEQDITADIDPILYSTSGALVANASTTVSGIGTLFSVDLQVGDYILVDNQIRRIETISNNTSMTVNTALTVSGSIFYRIETLIQENREDLVFPLTYRGIKNTASRAFSVIQRYDITSDGSGIGTVTTSSTVTGSTTAASSFSSAWDNTDLIVINKLTGAVQNPSYSFPDPSTITITGLSPSTTYAVFVPGFKSNAQSNPKTKTLVSNATKTFVKGTPDEVAPVTLSLGKADILRIIKIEDANGTDLTSWYSLDNGQRPSHYDLGSITRKPGYPIPSSDLTVIFDYFTHGQGDHFSRESYTSIRMEDIPLYIGTNTVLRLCDALDFRPRIDDTGTNFTGSGASLTQLPYRTAETQLDMDVYLPRIDKIALNYDGRFLLVSGVPSFNPRAPAEVTTAMTLYEVFVNPYTFSSSDITLNYIDNRRYTMRDIGKLEQRIKNVEYYTSLSLLEQETKNLKITDDFGLDRFKNCFLVDTFTSHLVGDTSTSEYRCAMDFSAGEVRPTYINQNINLSLFDASEVQITGDVASLPYNEVTYLEQPYASTIENLNPYAVFSYVGQLQLHPSTDEWIDTYTLPHLTTVQTVYLRNGEVITPEEVTVGTVTNYVEREYLGQTVTESSKTKTAIEEYGTGKFSINRTGQSIYDSLTPEQIAQIEQITGSTIAGTTEDIVVAVEKATTTNVTTVTDTTQTTASYTRNYLQQLGNDELASIDNKILLQTSVPWIRSREVRFIAKSLRPRAEFNAFFDGVNVNPYVITATRINLTSKSGNFTFDNSVTSPRGETERTSRGRFTANPGNNRSGVLERPRTTAVGQNSYIETNTVEIPDGLKSIIPASPSKKSYNIDVTQTVPLAYNRGEVVTQATTGASGIVVYAKGNDVYLLNVKGTFQTGYAVTGRNSGATGTVSSIELPVVPKRDNGKMLSSTKGVVVGVFTIPNTPLVRFKTGIREFKLSTETTGLDYIVGSTTVDTTTKAISEAKANYTAVGTLVTQQATYNYVRTFENLSDTSVITSTRRSTSTTTSVNSEITDAKCYTGPIAQTFQVTQKGGIFLTSIDIFFATKADDETLPVTLQIREVVNGYPGATILPFSTVTLDPDEIYTSDNSTTPTTFTFHSLVYLEEGKEYAIVLLTDSNQYYAWISQMGELNVVDDRVISRQPYLGSFFKSQNASAWTPEQFIDLKFTVKRASFSSLQGTLSLKNDPVPAALLVDNPFQSANGLNKVRVFHRDHGMKAGDNVIIAGAVTETSNIANVKINKENTISNVLTDSYVIEFLGNANVTGRLGGNIVLASQNYSFDSINPLVNFVTYNGTSARFFANVTVQSTEEQELIQVQPNAANEFDEPRVVLSEINEGPSNSLGLDIVLFSERENISPIIDLARTSALLKKNRLDCPVALMNTNSYNVPILDDRIILQANANVAFDATSGVIYSNNLGVQANLKTLNVGKIIEISGSLDNSGVYTVKTINSLNGNITIKETLVGNATPGNLITLTSRENFVDEISPTGGSGIAKYIQRTVQFINPSTFLKVMYEANSPQDCGIDMYYKIASPTSELAINDMDWVLATPKTPLVKNSNPSVFTDVEYEIADLEPFTQVKVKIVLRGVNTSKVPRVRNLRVIACA